MRRSITLIAVAVLLAGLGFGVKSQVSPMQVGACYWQRQGSSGVQYDSYYNYATGKYAYVAFVDTMYKDSCAGNWENDVSVWTTDGYAFSGGRVTSAISPQHGVSCNGGCQNSWNAAGLSVLSQTAYGIGSPGPAFGDDWGTSATIVYDAFGGSHQIGVWAE